MSNIVIKKDTFKRILSDVKDIIKDPMKDENIFYSHDEKNILKGYAMIIGPKDTCYHNGFFFFEFNFPNDYPWSPPKIIYKTNDGITRFNPNLYRDGKVCLSILNTWKGECWSSCQTIRSVLFVLQSILNNNPLLNEPGITSTHSDVKPYKKIIKYKSYEHALYKQYISDNGVFEIFRDDIKKYFINNKETIINELSKLSKKNYIETVKCLFYNITITIDYDSLILKFKEI
jgi:ubiquitin-protein ligase